MEPRLNFETGRAITADQFRDLLGRSTLAARRPADASTLQAMLDGADLTATCWDGGLLVGVARSVTDFAYCCYLSDLAVDVAYQRRGIGRRLIDETAAALRPGCKLVLLAAPAAEGYYPKVGFERHRSAWVRG